MYSLLLLGLVSFVAALVLTPLVRDLFARLGVVDHPDHSRKLHSHPVPRVGGVAIVSAVLVSYAVLLLSSLNAGDLVASSLPLVWRLLPAAGLVFLTGLLDDLITLRPWQKLLGQVVASVLTVVAGVQVRSLGGIAIPEWLGFLLTVVWLIGCANAFNLIDGVDGLAAGVGLFATTTTLIAALLQGNVPLALATVPLAGALLGFLRFNFNPATIFLGDCGSLTVGFLLGCYGVLWAQKSATLLGITAPLMALAVPLLDTFIAIVRRFLRFRPIFGADRQHIHHRLLALGHSPRQVALLIYGVCGIAAALSLLLSVATRDSFAGIILILFCAGAWVGVQHLGYVEFGTARRMLFQSAFRYHLNAQLALSAFQESLEAAPTPEQCWETLKSYAGEFGFSEICLRLAGNHYSDLTNEERPDGWHIQVPLTDEDYLILVRSFESQAQTPVVAPFVDSAARILRQKLLSFSGHERLPASV
jgi:UDP-N-acetylmuramyl pentapeptide phosphotransferase/UDP-N-acetylglucosamine-1-phosphate transferase